MSNKSNSNSDATSLATGLASFGNMSKQLTPAQIDNLEVPSIKSTSNVIISTSTEITTEEHENLSDRARNDNDVSCSSASFDLRAGG